jgi:hypothetical protein
MNLDFTVEIWRFLLAVIASTGHGVGEIWGPAAVISVSRPCLMLLQAFACCTMTESRENGQVEDNKRRREDIFSHPSHSKQV